MNEASLSAGTSSPEPNGVIENFPSVRLLTMVAIDWAPPKTVDSDFGKLDGMRQRTAGCDCAMLGMASVAVAPAVTADKRRRRFKAFSCFV